MTSFALAIGAALFPLSGRAQEHRTPKALVVEVQGAARNGWDVESAELQENFTGSTGVLRIVNRTGTPTIDAYFYGEYYDSRDRPCFELVFGQDQNFEERSGPFQPGEVRTLHAWAAYLNPATQPRRLELHLLTPPVAEDGKASVISALGLPSPLVLVPGGVAGKDWQKIWLVPEVVEQPSPIFDLLLAKVTVGDGGQLQDTAVIGAASDSVRSWFESFIAHQEFLQAGHERGNSTGSALLLVRALVSLHCLRQKSWPPRDSALVNEYIKRSPDAQIPPIITVLLQPQSRGDWLQPLSPGYFEEVGIGSSWNLPERRAEESERSPVHTAGPPLRKIEPPSDAYRCP